MRVGKGKADAMNQIFRITVGPETIQGRLPTCRVGRTYSSVFHIAGVSPDVAPPKIWVSVTTPSPDAGTPETTTTLFWTGVWSAKLGLWVVEVNNDPTQNAGSVPYALTVGGGVDKPEYIIGQGVYVVYDNIAAGGGASGGQPGDTLLSRITTLEDRVTEIELKLLAMTNLPLFDPIGAFDIDMRNQVHAITNILRGTP